MKKILITGAWENFNYLYLSLLIFALDQATKITVRFKMELYDEISVWGEFFKISYIENTKAAFGNGFESDLVNRIVFSCVKLLLIGVILWMLKRARSVWEKCAFALIIGGGVGNLIDRLLYGGVTDFLDFYFFNIFGWERWPTFNVADSAVVVAMFLLLIHAFFIERSERKKQKQGEQFTPPSAEI